MISEAEWLAICLTSESERPDEWVPLAWTIRNRVEDRRWPKTYKEVILQPMQFSFFNEFQGQPEADVFYQAMESYPGRSFNEALPCAEWVMCAPEWRRPFSSKVCHFWAPAAMHPPGSDPSWASRLRVFTLPGNHRWRFGEG